jgi:hypothetical protein
MATNDKLKVAAAGAAIGAAAGAATGFANAAAPHVIGKGAGVVNASSNFFNGASKALRSHKGVAGAVSAGTAAVFGGHTALAALAVTAAPAVAVTAAAGGAIFGVYKLVKYIQEEW